MTLRDSWRERKRPPRAVAVLWLVVAIGFAVGALLASHWWEIPMALALAVGLILLSLRNRSGSR